MGDVTWNHELHVRLESISNCTTCHHKDQQGDMTPRSCYECHDRPSNAEALVLFRPSAPVVLRVSVPPW